MPVSAFAGTAEFQRSRGSVLIFDVVPGLVAQGESVRLTRGRSLVRSQSGPQQVFAGQSRFSQNFIVRWAMRGLSPHLASPLLPCSPEPHSTGEV